MEISFDIFDISFDKVGIAAGGDVQPAVGTLESVESEGVRPR